MYLAHYGLEKKPFDISPDPSFLWLGEKHREALSYLKYGILENKGFLMITGDVGTGKTALIRRLTRLIDAATFVVTVPDPDMDKLDFFNFLADELNLDRTFNSKGEFLIAFKRFLRGVCSDHRKVLLIIDESQRLNHELLQEIRLLSNIDLGGQVPLNIFFVGQTEFNQILNEERNLTVRQRITASFHLDPLNAEEVKNYIVHRLRIAGAGSRIFSDEAIQRVFDYTSGYPRLINILCDHALMTGYSTGATAILPSIVDECASELSITFGNFAGSAAPKKALRPEPMPAADPEPATPAPPRPRPEPAPDSSQEVVQQMASAAAERRTSFLRPLALAFAVLLIIFGAVYFAYDPVLSYLAGEDRNDSSPPPLASFSRQNDSPAATGLPAAENESGAGADQPVATEVPTAYRTDAGKDSSAPKAPSAANPAEESVASNSAAAAVASNSAAAKPGKKPAAAARRNDADTSGAEPASGQGAADTASGDSGSDASMLASISSGKGGEVSSKQPAGTDENTETEMSAQRAIIYFDTDSHEMSSEAAFKLARMVGAAARFPDSIISIQGFTDSLGNEWYNRKLSQTRADIVRDYFVERGVDPRKIRSIGLGSQYPLAGNDTAEGRRKNRRVEISIGSAVN